MGINRTYIWVKDSFLSMLSRRITRITVRSVVFLKFDDKPSKIPSKHKLSNSSDDGFVRSSHSPGLSRLNFKVLTKIQAKTKKMK